MTYNVYLQDHSGITTREDTIDAKDDKQARATTWADLPAVDKWRSIPTAGTVFKRKLGYGFSVLLTII